MKGGQAEIERPWQNNRELYPADRPRNSNLNVRELTGKALMRLFPMSLSEAHQLVGEARQLVDHFAQL